MSFLDGLMGFLARGNQYDPIIVTPDGFAPVGMQIKGSSVTVGGTAFGFDGPRTLYGADADRPAAATAHAVVPFAYYVAVDIPGTVYQTDGTNWQVQ